MIRIFWLVILVLFLVGLSIGFASSTTSQEDTMEEPEASPCEGVSIGEAKANITVNGSEIVMEGLYCANTGGYAVVDESMNEDGDSVEVSVVIDGPEDDRMVTQVITPVNFSMSDEVDDGRYSVDYEVIVEDQVIESGSEDIDVGDKDESSNMFNRFSSWLSSLF